jgi:hypothetical protein
MPPATVTRFADREEAAHRSGSDCQETYSLGPRIECTNYMIEMYTGSHILKRKKRSKINVGLSKALAHDSKNTCEHDMDWVFRL